MVTYFKVDGSRFSVGALRFYRGVASAHAKIQHGVRESQYLSELKKEEYQLLLSELDRLGIVNFYDTIEMSVLGHYLPSSLSSFRNCVNFIQNNFTMLKSQCKRIFDLAAAISISSSRRIFMAKSCQEWCVDF